MKIVKMKKMRIRCRDREHADRAIVAARKMGYNPKNDYKANTTGTWDTLYLYEDGSGDFQFWREHCPDWPEYALYGDVLLPVSEGWIENTGECPVAKGTKVDVVYRDGKTEEGIPALLSTHHYRRSALEWRTRHHDYDIIAYRLAESAEKKADLTPCQQRGLAEGQWVWRHRGSSGTLTTGWVKLTRDDGTKIPYFYDPREQKNTYGQLEYTDFTHGIHDTMPDWSPVEVSNWDTSRVTRLMDDGRILPPLTDDVLEKALQEAPEPSVDDKEGGKLRFSDEACEVLGWILAECCNILDKGEDPREMHVVDMIERCRYDLKMKHKIDHFITATGVNDTPDVRKALSELLKRGVSFPNCD